MVVVWHNNMIQSNVDICNDITLYCKIKNIRRHIRELMQLDCKIKAKDLHCGWQVSPKPI